MVRYANRYTVFVAALAALICSSGCRRKIYENPITKDTQQPDKVLYDTAIDDIEHGRFERARLTLQTLMNTYDTSEFLAKAKLADADSWYREGGARGLAQAEAGYKDFILFYKNMEEAAEAQMKICQMQFDQMDKADRDPTHALRAQEECKNVLLEFPNSQHSVVAEQHLRIVQDILADEEARVQTFYYKKGSFPASASRGQALADQWPLYSNAGDSLWMLAGAYQHLGDRFEDQQAAAYAKIVQDHPLSAWAEEAKLRLKAMGRPVPEADPSAYARDLYEQQNREKRGFMSKVWGPFGSRPYTGDAAKSGNPTMETFRPGIPVSVPVTAQTGTPTGTPAVGGTGDVNAAIEKDPNLIDKAPDARNMKSETPAPATGGTATPVAPGATPATDTPAGGTPAPAAIGTKPAPATKTTPGAKAKPLSSQEADVRREQDRIKKEKAQIQASQKKRYDELMKMNQKQQIAQAKKKAAEDAERKKAADAAAKKSRRQRISTSDDTDKQPDKQPDKAPDKPAAPGGGGEAPSPVQ